MVSLHKLFGPHLGCIVGNRQSMTQLLCCDKAGTTGLQSDEDLCKSWEVGTMNYEACCGAIAVKQYFDMIGSASPTTIVDSKSSCIDNARKCIQRVENRLLDRVLGYLQSCALVRIIQDADQMKVKPYDVENETDLQRIPIVCFVHASIQSHDIVKHCRRHGIICRAGKFLATNLLWDKLNIRDDGVVRFSLAHYNTIEEIEAAIEVLELLDGWS